jgi:signal peptide peptidase SppA
VNDKDVSAIILDVASPGGMTDMISELATDIRQARGKKPIVAVANTKAASAAYWIASQADEVVVTPSGSVGSVGAFAAHDDLSGAMEKAGIKTTLVSAGKFKTEANPYEPLSDEARAMIQERVDDAYAMFTGDVAKGRRVPVDTVRGGYGEGRMVSAKQAVKLGMADSIGTLQQTVERFTNPQAASAGVEAGTFAENIVATYSQPNVYPGSFVEQTDALHDGAVALLERLTSLAEVETGRLTKAKRQSLAACSGAIREVANTVDGVLADTDPNKSRAVLDGLLLADIARRHLTT